MSSQSVQVIVFLLSIFVNFVLSGKNSFGSGSRKVKREPLHTYGYGTNSYHDNIMDHYPRFEGKDQIFIQNQPILNFPIGTELKLVPSIEIPILKFGTFEGDFDTKVKTEFPLTFTFKNKSKPVPADFPDDPFILLPKLGYSNTQTVIERQPGDSVNEILSRKSRDLHGNFTHWPYTKKVHTVPPRFPVPYKCSLQGLTDRRNVLQKIEVLVKQFIGENSSLDCLLRWSCELHAHSDSINKYGLLGETALLVFKINEISTDCDTKSSQIKYLLPFIKAETLGNSRKCQTLQKNCSVSIFA